MKQTEAVAMIGVLILAAGASTRLGKPKQLLQYRGQSFLRHTAKMAIASGCQPVVVVLGAQAKQLRSELSDLPVTIMENHDWATGISSSIHVELEALQAQSLVPLRKSGSHEKKRFMATKNEMNPNVRHF